MPHPDRKCVSPEENFILCSKKSVSGGRKKKKHHPLTGSAGLCQTQLSRVAGIPRRVDVCTQGPPSATGRAVLEGSSEAPEVTCPGPLGSQPDCISCKSHVSFPRLFPNSKIFCICLTSPPEEGASFWFGTLLCSFLHP